MTVTMPVRNDSTIATVDVGASTTETLVPGPTRPARMRSRFLPVSVLVDAVVPLTMLPVLLKRSAGVGHLLTMTSITVVATWLILLAVFGAYDARRTVVDTDLVRRLTMAGVCFAALLPVVFSAAGHRVEPLRMLLTAALMTTAAVLQRGVTHTLTGRVGRVATPVRVVISGHRRAVDRVLEELATDTRSAYEVVHVCGHIPDGSELSATAQQLGAQAVVVVPCRHHDSMYVRRLGWQLERTGVNLLVGTGLHDVSRFRTTVEYAGAMPLVRVRPPGLDSGRMKLKRAMDTLVGLVALVVLTPVMAVVAAVIMLESPGNALFRQTRIGKDGTPFEIFKFRTMRVGADAGARQSGRCRRRRERAVQASW